MYEVFTLDITETITDIKMLLRPFCFLDNNISYISYNLSQYFKQIHIS